MLHSINGSACTSIEKVWRQARSALKRAARWKAVFESRPSNTSAVNLLEPGKLAFNICGIAMKDPGGAATWMTFSCPCNIDPRHAARVHWSNVCQVSLATIALHAGWKLRSLARQRLLDPLRLVPSAFGLSHGHSFK